MALGQNISGIYLNTDDFGPSQLVVKHVDETISVELNDGRNEIKLTGILEDNMLLFDTTEMPFTLSSILNKETITLFFQSKDTEEVESIEFSFKFAIALPTASRAPQNALSHLLQFIPATKEVYESELFFTNLWALSGFRDAGVFQSQENFLNFQKSEAQDAYIKNLRLYIQYPFGSQNLSVLWEDMPDTVGFSWFDVQASLSYGTLPKNAHLNLTTAARAPIKTTLDKLGFVEEPFQEQTIWTKGEDGTLDLDNRNPSNPLNHLRNSSNRQERVK